MSFLLGTCTRMCARISQVQCDKNRKGVPAHGPKPAVPPCFACEGCAGLVDVTGVDYTPPPPAQAPVIAPLMSEPEIIIVDGFYGDEEPELPQPAQMVPDPPRPAPVRQKRKRKPFDKTQPDYDVPPMITARILVRVIAILERKAA